jgi:putative Mg2+ transporter-C (MgtC) family protein
MLTHVDMISRIAAGAALGAVIGYERDLHRRPVGLRTHLIVAMAAATFMVISSQFVYWQHYHEGDFVEVDASRIAASVVSGIGFLAGGAILRTGFTIQGLTTAAGLWLVTAIGMCAGSGMFVESAFVTLMGIVALTVLRRFEDKNLLHRRVTVVLSGPGARPEAVVEALGRLGVSTADVEYERRLDDELGELVATFDVQFADTMGVTRLIAAVEAVAGVRRIRVRQHL